MKEIHYNSVMLETKHYRLQSTQLLREVQVPWTPDDSGLVQYESLAEAETGVLTSVGFGRGMKNCAKFFYSETVPTVNPSLFELVLSRGWVGFLVNLKKETGFIFNRNVKIQIPYQIMPFSISDIVFGVILQRRVAPSTHQIYDIAKEYLQTTRVERKYNPDPKSVFFDALNIGNLIMIKNRNSIIRDPTKDFESFPLESL